MPPETPTPTDCRGKKFTPDGIGTDTTNDADDDRATPSPANRLLVAREELKLAADGFADNGDEACAYLVQSAMQSLETAIDVLAQTEPTATRGDGGDA